MDPFENQDEFHEEYKMFKEYFEKIDECGYNDEAIDMRQEINNSISDLDKDEQLQKWMTYYTLYNRSK